MPTCKYCFLYNQEKLESVCCFFQDRHSVVLFLSNVILSIQDLWTKFCKCDGENISLPCQANICYREYQYTIYKNCLNLDFFTKVRENIHINLLKMVFSNNHFLCQIINNKYCYHHNDWFTGDNVSYELEFCLTSHEQQKIKEIIDTDFKIVL